MSTSLLTRDGSFSAAAAQLRDEEQRLGEERVSVATALAWAEAQGIRPKDGRLPVAEVNERRRSLGLPAFRVVREAAVPRVVERANLPVEQVSTSQAAENERLEIQAGKIAENPVVARPETGELKPRHGDALPPLAASESELLDLVTGYNGTRTGTVTPEIAGWLLALNTGNRPLSKTQVERFKRILAAGDWKNTGEPVIVSREGVLNDGQHRLHAIAESGIAAEMDVRFGIARAAFPATGTSKPRTAANVLSIAGHKHASTQAALAKLLTLYDARQMGKIGRALESADLAELVAATPLIGTIAEKIQSFRFSPARTAPFGMPLVVAARTWPLERVFAFADIAAGGIPPSESDPAHVLHVRLRDAAIARERFNQIDQVVLTVRAWNAWVRGRELSRLVVSDTDRTNEGFPQIIAAPQER